MSATPHFRIVHSHTRPRHILISDGDYLYALQKNDFPNTLPVTDNVLADHLAAARLHATARIATCPSCGNPIGDYDHDCLNW